MSAIMINSIKGIITYLKRLSYCRIQGLLAVTDNKVTFFFNDLANDKKKTYIAISNDFSIILDIILLFPHMAGES